MKYTQRSLSVHLGSKEYSQNWDAIFGNPLRALFNRVKTHLLTQGKRSETDGSYCLYRSSTGLKCAVGCLIKDEHYSNNLEGITLGDLNYGDLQAVHDAFAPTDWPYQLDMVKRRNF